MTTNDRRKRSVLSAFRNGTILPGPVRAIKRTESEDFVWRGGVFLD